MRVLLDGHIPLRLYRRLREENPDIEHLALDQRGIPDAEIIRRLTDDADLVLVTQDKDFEKVRILRGGKVLISRLHQSLPIDERVRAWLLALQSEIQVGHVGPDLQFQPEDEDAYFTRRRANRFSHFGPRERSRRGVSARHERA